MGAMNKFDLGYVFYKGQSLLGEARLDVIIRREPTYEHFDPEKVRLKIKTTQGVQTLDIQHPWRQSDGMQLCPGHIRVIDRYQKFIDVFTFGGQVQITAVAASSGQTATPTTTCIITSPAPLLELTAGSPIITLFANEIDSLYARQKARLNLRFAAEFDSKLADIDPLRLYTTCLNHLRKKFADNTIYFDRTHQFFKQKLNQEVARLQQGDNWPSCIPTFADLIDA
ncbi:MAG: hypothetical protein CSB13_07995 [Chloroflexi bacterium]|nr:MAG: hypothetical protein CSB13_07995 [Chloroflexota bacterium]